MRVRQMDSSGDYTFGRGSANFLVDSAEMVVQKILTGLMLFQGEFFLNTSAGMPWKTRVLGFGTQSLYDNAIKNQIRSTAGVTSITSYTSSLNKTTRLLTVIVGGQSAFGPFSLTTALSFAPPPLGGYGVGGLGMNPYGA